VAALGSARTAQRRYTRRGGGGRAGARGLKLCLYKAPNPRLRRGAHAEGGDGVPGLDTGAAAWLLARMGSSGPALGQNG
jgi:hypothetical protein